MAARLGSTSSTRAQEMRRVLQQWERSGLTLEEFGQRQSIPRTTLVWWRHVFRHARKKRRVANGGRPYPPDRGRAGAPAVFREVQLTRSGTRPAPAVLEVVLRSGHVLHVPAGVEATTLQAVIAVLERAC
jgi:hypothetical protein